MDRGVVRMTSAIEKVADSLERIAAAMEKPKGGDIKNIADAVEKELIERAKRSPTSFL